MKAKLSVLVLLAAMSGLWMRSEAVCAIQAPEGLYQEFTTKIGELINIGYPCEEGMDCPTCLTVALIAEGKTYYLTGLSEEQQQLIDNTVYGIYNTDWPYRPVRATVSGTPYQGGSFDFIKVLDIVFEEEKLHSLCDEWNVLGNAFGDGYPHYSMLYYNLGDPTMIGDKLYYKLYENGGYIGALREGENRDIYYIPYGTEHEYLLYAFNAKEGDVLTNLWIGGSPDEYPDGWIMTVEDIQETSPRIFTLCTGDSENYRICTYWIEGVGMICSPAGKSCLDGDEYYGQHVICAYTLGVQVYASEDGKKFGCAAPTAVHDKKLLNGSWEVYKERTYRENTHRTPDEPIYEEITPLHNVDDDALYVFDDSSTVVICPTCYSVPASYTLTYYTDTTSMLEIDGTMAKYFIHKLTPTEMEWRYTDYNNEEGSITYYQYLRRSPTYEKEEDLIPSLCDTWNVLEIYGDMGPEYETWRTVHYALGEETTINNKVYYKLFKDGAHAGALREDENGRIYIYPSNGWQQEFLIYDFNAQVGDTLKDLYIGNRYFEYGPEILYATVEDIKPTTPRTFVLDVVYIFPGIEDAEQLHWEIKWIEGIGMIDGPVGNECPLECAGGPGMELLCAYKLGVQVYTSELGEKYGCEVDGIEEVSDTLCFNSLVSIAALQPCQETGTLQKVDYICWPGDDRCPCKTIALVTGDNRIIYLSAPDTKTKSQLEALGNHINEHATITGGIISSGEYNLISVETISIDDTSIHSLCDEWHMLEPAFMWPDKDDFYTERLTTDTIIEGRHYVKLEKENQSKTTYKGALREEGERVYYIPMGSIHEYLLYDFTVEEGDTLTNLWIGGSESEYEEGFISDIIVEDIEGSAPSRKFYLYSRHGMFRWIEGVGLNEGPAGWNFISGTPVDPTPGILCAYKKGELVYMSAWGEEYGCDFDGVEEVSDTIPLYAQDDPGSSTVDPIDPNQVVVTLKGDELTIRENSGEEITYNLEKHETGERREARGERRVEGVQSNTFHNIVTVRLTEEGEYQLVLTNPKWPYSIIGRFSYPRATNSIDPIPNPYDSKARKVLINGQLFILRDGHIYTLTGICVP